MSSESLLTATDRQLRLLLWIALYLVISGCRTVSAVTISPTSPVELSNGSPPAIPTSIPDLITALSSSSAEVRIGAAHRLGNMGPAAQPAVPALARNLNYPHTYDVREAAAEALGAIGPTAKPSIPVLIVVLLTDSSLHVRRASAEALERIGDVSAIPALASGLADQDSGVEVQCAKAIAALAHQDFPDANSTIYRVGNDGVPLIVTAAREWWQSEGQTQTWLSSDVQ